MQQLQLQLLLYILHLWIVSIGYTPTTTQCKIAALLNRLPSDTVFQSWFLTVSLWHRLLRPHCLGRCMSTRKTSSSGQSTWAASAGHSWCTTGLPSLSSALKKGNGTSQRQGSFRRVCTATLEQCWGHQHCCKHVANMLTTCDAKHVVTLPTQWLTEHLQVSLLLCGRA